MVSTLFTPWGAMRMGLGFPVGGYSTLQLSSSCCKMADSYLRVVCGELLVDCFLRLMRPVIRFCSREGVSVGDENYIYM